MKLHARPLGTLTLACPPRRLSDRARRLPWVIGRETRAWRVEVGAGAALIAGAGQAQRSVDCLILPLTDDELRDLSRLDDAESGLIADVAAMQILVRHGLKVAQAGRALGITDRADAQKLARLAELHPRVLAACQERKLTANHARWLLGLAPEVALARVMCVPLTTAPKSRRKRGRLPSVAHLRQLAAKDARAAEAEAPPPVVSSDTDPAFAREADRLSALLATRVRLVGGAAGGELQIGFADAEALIGALERLGRFGHPCPAGSEDMRFVRIPFASLDELAYLVGTADG